ncbi:caveolin-2-like [Mizuhopecten yessoensis]|uniref:Caveolin n=1 Tax=Mizuhopecten yessoensis TaxID=6573 RepID=A0A210PQJ3_MIZYE|nr:caveolin-2-like [Mizuhopecten yessoensis]OWF38716.1 Caveolin-2 [Mizuhopecten yessoensis]
MPPNRVLPKPPPTRDPNGLNSHLTIQFPDVLAEQNSPKSLDIIWDCSEIWYSCWSACCYGLLTLFTGPCIASVWACQFAYVAFAHVWCLSPILINVRLCMFDCLQRGVRSVINCCIVPWTTACGSFFHLCPVKRKPLIPAPEVKKPPSPEIMIVIPKGKDVSKSIKRQLGLFMR